MNSLCCCRWLDFLGPPPPSSTSLYFSKVLLLVVGRRWGNRAAAESWRNSSSSCKDFEQDDNKSTAENNSLNITQQRRLPPCGGRGKGKAYLLFQLIPSQRVVPRPTRITFLSPHTLARWMPSFSPVLALLFWSNVTTFSLLLLLSMSSSEGSGGSGQIIIPVRCPRTDGCWVLMVIARQLLSVFMRSFPSTQFCRRRGRQEQAAASFFTIRVRQDAFSSSSSSSSPLFFSPFKRVQPQQQHRTAPQREGREKTGNKKNLSTIHPNRKEREKECLLLNRAVYNLKRERSIYINNE